MAVLADVFCGSLTWAVDGGGHIHAPAVFLRGKNPGTKGNLIDTNVSARPAASIFRWETGWAPEPVWTLQNRVSNTTVDHNEMYI
jgi:hypothetical protein